MIAVERVLPREDFEDLLAKSVDKLKITVQVGRTLSNREFEQTVLNAMQLEAKGTDFERKIYETGDMEFPDIVAATYYGVEVKQTKKKNFVASGNSIFEQSRVEDIKFLYAVIGNPRDVMWRRYEECLYNIIVTHSPRYAIDGEAEFTVFDKMGVTYEEFRKLGQKEKMEQVKPLYEDRNLWWLLQAETPRLRYFSSLSTKEKSMFIATAMLACPAVFGSYQKKFEDVSVLAMSQGIVIPNVRDLFTAGGTGFIRAKRYPRIYLKAVIMENLLRETIMGIDNELLEQFWNMPGAVPDDFDGRWARWIDLVQLHNRNEYKISDILTK